MKKFFKNLAMACLAALSCVAIGLGTGCEAVNSVLGTFESLGGHIGNVIDKVTHECEYNVMKHDADNHWNECECGEKDETSVAAHVYDNACDTTCNVCGAERNVADHVYDNACDKTCNVCGAERKVADHVYDNACDTTCNECGAERKVADHVYDNACDADCNVCGATRTPADHVYDNACDKTCNVCGAERKVADHVYDNACDTTCNECGAEREITHDYSKYASDETNHWKVCSVCGVKDESTVAAHTGGEATATEQAKCEVCGAPYGETLPYVTAALTLDGDATNVTIPAGKYAQVSVNTMFETIVLSFEGNVTVTVNGEEVENGAIVEYNYRTSIVVTPVDATAETVATLKASTYVDPSTILTPGTHTVNGTFDGESYTFTGEVGKAYDLIFDSTVLIINVEYSNGVTDSYVSSGYVIKVEEGVSITIVSMCAGWDDTTGEITIAAHTTHTYVWMKDLNNHWQGCGCGVVVDGTMAAHTYDYECSDTCNVCNAYRFNAASHDYTVAGHDKDGHWMECVCGTRDYSSYEKHYGGEATDSEQAVCEVCGESYGDTLTTAFKDLKIDFPYGLIELTVPAGKILVVNLLIEENAYLKITFEGDVTVMFGRRSIASGDVIEVSNFMHTLTVIANDNTEDTVVKMNADTYVVENGELVLGENEVEVLNCPELEFVFTAEEANTYTITADDTLWLSLKTENGSETVDSGYTFTLEAGASITFIIIPSDWNSQATGKVTIAVKTAEEHTHSYTTLKSDADNHWYECECGEKDETSVATHDYDNACDTTCNVCNAERAIEHTYDNACDADCNVCGATRTPADHVYDNACDADCNVCGATRTPADHKYDDKYDLDCNVCGAKREVELTIAEALEYGATFTHNTYSAGKYYVTATVKEVYDTKYGNMYVIDGEGNQLTVYGTYSADGSVRYDAMESKPVAGDTVRLYGIIGQFSSTAQMKNSCLIKCESTDAGKILVDKETLKLSATDLKKADDSISLTTAGTNGSTIAWALKETSEYVSLAEGKLTVVSLPTKEDVKVVLVAALTLNGLTATKEFTVTVRVPLQVVATFEFGDNVDSTTHADGSAISSGKAYTSGDYTLTLNDITNVYDGANDAKGNSALKLGTSKKTGSFSFTVADNVKSVEIKVAGYKAATSTKIKINGKEYTVTTASNNGEYTTITIDTTTTKTVEFVTVTNRAMIDSISFLA